MSKKFVNLRSGLVEEVFNKDVIEQCEKHPEAWEEVKDAPSKKEKATDKKTEDNE